MGIKAITPEMVEQVESKLRKEIKHEQERIRILTLLEPLAGKYCTKRIEPELQALFPDYKSVYLHKEYNNRLEVVLSNPGMDYWHDAYHLTIADADVKRVDADRIKQQIETAEKEIKRKTKKGKSNA